MTSDRDTLADDLRQRIIHGEFSPGDRLSEVALADLLGVSRNTLREAFRVLAEQGLIVHVPHRGASVASPTLADVIDIYRTRRVIEPAALLLATPHHPSISRMTDAVQHSREAIESRDWIGTGSANMDFHAAIVDFADSPRLARIFRDVSAELRLAFLKLDSPEHLHTPFVERNAALLDTLLTKGNEAAAAQLTEYLATSERGMLGAFSRLGFG